SHCARRELTPDRLDKDRRGRAYKSFQNYAEIRSRQIFSGRVYTASITIHTDNEFSTKRVCDFVATFHEDRRARLFPARAMKSQIQSLTYFGAVLVIFGVWARPARGEQQQHPISFQVQ